MYLFTIAIVLVSQLSSITDAEGEIHCGQLGSLQFGDITASRPSPYTTGTVLTFKCDVGFKGMGKTRITCLENGQWSDPMPYCSPDSCQRDLTKVDKRRKCRKRCRTNRDCRGGFKQCLCDDWCGKSCFNPDADCPQPVTPENGYVIRNKLSYGNTITYGCYDGFTLTGPTTRRCQSDRKWSGVEPKCAAFSSCGHSTYETENRISGKVIHGTDAKVGEWPWQVHLFHKNQYLVRRFHDPKSGFGGGSIINNGWILSAAHVFDILPFGKPEKHFLMAVGMTNYPVQGQLIPDHINFFEAKKVHRHPDFDSSSYDYDMALIKVGKRLKQDGNIFAEDADFAEGMIIFSQYIRPVCLPCMKGDMLKEVDIWKNFDKKICNPKSRSSKPSDYSAGDKVMVTGFGKKRDIDGQLDYKPNILQRGELEVLDDGRCVKAIRKIQAEDNDARYTNRMICAESANKTLNVDACQGDSGGPLVKQLENSSNNKQWLQIGVVSWGWNCGNQYPGFYTSVSKLMPWVWKIIDANRNEVKIDHCLSSPCKQGKCTSEKEGFTCSCIPGYQGDRCEINVDDCKPNPCFNGGICEDKVDDFSCSCAEGFKGKVCEIDIDDCRPNPCLNKGKCHDMPNEFSCSCHVGYRGKRCEIDINDCLPNPCRNGGKCIDKVNNFLCSCIDGFRGKKCEIDIDDCSPNPCLNGGKCKDDINTFSCTCAQGYKGKICENEINHCLDSPCKNGGRCKNSPTGFRCYCRPGFQGDTCEIEDYCLTSPCKNGGRCVNTPAEFKCFCPPGFRGETCEIGVYCSPNPCRNNGKCYDANDGYVCRCTSGFRGINCEIDINCKRDMKRLESGWGCRKPCLSDRDCSGALKKCVCDGWCGMSCFNPEAECPPVKNPRNGYVLAGKLTYGSTVRYDCNEGYTLVGSDKRVCRSDRKWSGLEPLCIDYSICGEDVPMNPSFLNQISPRRVKRVVGGEDATENAWPWHVNIIRTVNSRSGNVDISATLERWSLLFSGTIINKDWILTVAHAQDHIHGLFNETYALVLGVSDKSSVKTFIKSTVQMFRPEKYIPHEKFNRTSYENDIALIKVGERILPKTKSRTVYTGGIRFSASVRPVCLPCTSKCLTNDLVRDEFNRPIINWRMRPTEKCKHEGDFLARTGNKLVLTGFGQNTSRYSTFPDKLQQVVLKVSNIDSCQDGLHQINANHGMNVYEYVDSLLCTTSSIPNKVMTGCSADGGGPLVKKITQRNGRECWVQVGISSFGEGCDGNIPEYYTKVSSFSSWIETTMNEN